MRTLLLIATKDIAELLKEQRMLLMFIVTAFILLSLPYDMVENIGRSHPFLLVQALDMFMIYFSLMGILFISYAAVYRVFYREKNSGTLSALMAAPVTIRQIWLGKSLAVAVTAYLFSLLLAAAFVFLVNHTTGLSVYPSPGAVLLLLFVNPLLAFLLVALLGILYLLIKDEMKARIGFFILIFGGFYLLKAVRLPQAGQVAPYLLLLLFVLFLANVILLRLLSNERVVLSMDR